VASDRGAQAGGERGEDACLLLWVGVGVGGGAAVVARLPDDLGGGTGGDRALIPDFCVVNRRGFDGVILSTRHVVLVGEIASPSTRVYDRATKRTLYAEAGVPCLHGRSEQPLSAVCYELLDGGYVKRVRSEDGLLRLDRSFRVRLTLTFPAPS